MNDEEKNSDSAKMIKNIMEQLKECEEKEFKEENISKRSLICDKKHLTISENIRHYRKANSLSQEYLAEKLNIDRGTVVNWETGKTAPNAWQMEDMAKIFNISTSELHTKTVWNYSDSSDERKRWAKLEENWLKGHPVLLSGKPKAGYNTFWESDFSRDYFHPARKDIVVIAYELALRGYAVTWMGFNFDESCIDPTDDYYAAFDVFIKDNQIENFCDAISEVIIDYVSCTSRFDEVVNLRKRIIKEKKKDESIRKDASQILFEMESDNELSNPYCIAYRKDTKTDSTPICSGMLKDVAQKLKAKGIYSYKLYFVFINKYYDVDNGKKEESAWQL